jgi:hypothetical protein
VDSLIYSIHQTKNWYISPMCSAVQCSSSSKARGDFASNLLSTHCFLTGHSRNPMQRASIFVFGKSDRGRGWQKSWIRSVKSETNRMNMIFKFWIKCRLNSWLLVCFPEFPLKVIGDVPRSLVHFWLVNISTDSRYVDIGRWFDRCAAQIKFLLCKIQI